MNFVYKLLVLLSLLVIVACKDLYAVLGLDKTATNKEIRSAYRQLSLKYHPDKNPGSDEAHEKFLEIGEAYEILNNAEKRSNYDQFGDPEGQRQQQYDFGDMFNQFFGGHHQQHHQQQRRGDNTQVNLHVPLSDFYNGKLIDFDVEMVNICTVCEGTGSKDKVTHKCTKCGGSGMMLIKRQIAPGMIQQIQMQCDQCRGQGKQIEHPCTTCGGQGCKSGPRHYEVYVKPGQVRGSNVVLAGEGDRRPGITPGDLFINIQEEFSKSWGYRRINSNLYRTEVLTLNESLHGGWTRMIPFLDDDDNQLKLHREPGKIVTNGEIEIIKDRGMPKDDEHHSDEYGNLYIEYKVLVPGGSKKSSQKEHDEL